MSAYRYVVFPRGKQPTVDEIRQLQGFASALANQFVWGTGRHDGRLAIAFDGRAYDHVMTIDAGFDSLIRKWESSGCEPLDHLAFVKDPSALRPAPTTTWQTHAGRGLAIPVRYNQEQLAAKELAAKEAVGRSLLSVQRTIARYALVERIATSVPYLLIVVFASATIALGLYIRDRMQNADRESRHETIVRVVDDPLRESLAGKPGSPQP